VEAAKKLHVRILHRDIPNFSNVLGLWIHHRHRFHDETKGSASVNHWEQRVRQTFGFDDALSVR